MSMERPGSDTSIVVALALACGIPWLISGCAAATSMDATLLEISPDAASGPDYIAHGRIEGPDDVDYYRLVLNQTFNTVTIMTGGPTDTAGQVETATRVPITMICEGERPEAAPPCVWGSDEDIDTPNPERPAKFNSMAPSTNFLWEGKLAAGTYYIRVTGQRDSTGPYVLTVETVNIDCPVTEENPFGYYCED